MTVSLREDIAFVMLKKIQQASDKDRIQFAESDFMGRDLTIKDYLGHLDYLNQKGFIKANFSGDAYADEGPNPFPSEVQLESAKLTQRGKDLLDRMEQNPPESFKRGAAVPIATQNTDFLEKVAIKGHLSDIFDARDVTTVVYRTMRDLMPSEVSESVAEELHEPMLETDNKTLQQEIADLWTDTNPIVSFISAIRPQLNFSSELFLQRIKQEAGLQRDTQPETVVNAVFSATKDELPADQIEQIEQHLPAEIRQMWQEA